MIYQLDVMADLDRKNRKQDDRKGNQQNDIPNTISTLTLYDICFPAFQLSCRYMFSS